MKLVVGFRLLAATIDIAALVKSVGAAYQYVGPGQCLDSSGEHYDYAYLSGQINNIDAAYNWCLSATNYKSKLVGFDISNVNLVCRYDNGAINNIQNTDFRPTAASGLSTAYSGTGAVMKLSVYTIASCYKNLVRRIDYNCVISSLIFSYLLSRRPLIPSYCIRIMCHPPYLQHLQA
jgi:hypothetical protein